MKVERFEEPNLGDGCPGQEEDAEQSEADAPGMYGVYNGGDCCHSNARGGQGFLGPGSVDEGCCSWNSDQGVHFGEGVDQWTIVQGEGILGVRSPSLRSATCIAS